MNAQFLLIFSTALATLGLGIAVFIKQPHGRLNRYFAFFAVSVAAWTLCNALAPRSTGSATALARLAFASASIIPMAFLAFASIFPSNGHVLRRGQLLTATAVSAAFTIVSFTPLMVKNAVRLGDTLHVSYGVLHLPFGIYFVSCFGVALSILTRKLRRLTGFQQLQVRYLFLGVLTAVIGATITNLIIPLLAGTSKFSRYGPLFGLLMVAMIAHSIVRHRLMDIRLVMRQGSVYLLAAAIAGTVFAIVIALITQILGDQAQEVPLPVQVVVALCIALAFDPLKRRLQSSLDRYLYRESYDYSGTVREASRTINSTLNLAELVSYLSRIISQTLRPDMVCLYMRESGSDTFALQTAHSGADVQSPPPPPLALAAALPAALAKRGSQLIRDELHRTFSDTISEQAVAEMITMGAEVAVPMLSDRQLVGFLLVGPKLSGDPYFDEDIGILTTLANQAAVAVRNAQLYQQVVLVNEYIENILRTMDSGVITIDASGKVAICNSTAENLLGLSRAALTALTVDELPTAIRLQLRATLRDGTPRLQVESALTDDPDRGIPIVASTSALHDRQGVIHGALVVFSDVTKIKELENEKRRAERLAAFSAFVSGIAHEIKNPLVAIRTFAELLPERFTETDFRDDFAKVVIGEIDRIDDLVARLRGLAAPPKQAAAVIDVRDPILETLALLRAQLDALGIHVIREFEDSEPFVVVDAAQLKQLILNLFLNATEAMGGPGQLTVSITRRMAGAGSWVSIAVQDTGPGIPEEIRTNIFDPFFTTKARGSGLGLAICRGITDAHRGTIRAENLPGKGTAIIVEFPAASETNRRTVQDAVARSA